MRGENEVIAEMKQEEEGQIWGWREERDAGLGKSKTVGNNISE